MSQLTFAEAEYTTKKRKTRRELFLEHLDKLLPWKQLETPIAKHYARGGIGRPPYPLSMMLRIHIMQLVYNLSDLAMEDALYEIESMRRFAGVRLDKIPDETTILNFRHLLEKHNLGKKLFQKINKHLDQHGLILREGSIVDATIISSPSSTKNKKGALDPEMHQTRKGKEWHFGMKMHIGVDESLGLIHSVETTPENEHDLNVAHKLLHGDEQRVWADAGYGGAKKLKSLKNGTWNGLLVCAQAHVKSLVVHIQKSREDKGQCSGQSRACFLLYQTHVWLQQDSLSRFGEKHQSPLCVIGVGELTSLSKISAGLGPVCLKSA